MIVTLKSNARSYNRKPTWLLVDSIDEGARQEPVFCASSSMYQGEKKANSRKVAFDIGT
jgi:hypothetical protein